MATFVQLGYTKIGLDVTVTIIAMAKGIDSVPGPNL
jgi:hypothetical protein